MRRAALALLTALLLAVGFLPTGATAAGKAPAFRALLFTKAVGYVHGSIPDGIKMVQEQAAANNFEVVQTDDSTVFDDAKLKDFDVIIMLQNSGMVWDTDGQREALQKYVRGGKGVVAIHNTLDMGVEEQFPWWDETINGGAHMPAHSPGVLQGTAKVADRVHPSTKGLPERWERPEEWYNFD
ncbi:ThuA domain-containing protein, partial [Streptomyces sp. NPDC001940]